MIRFTAMPGPQDFLIGGEEIFAKPLNGMIEHAENVLLSVRSFLISKGLLPSYFPSASRYFFESSKRASTTVSRCLRAVSSAWERSFRICCSVKRSLVRGSATARVDRARD